jgi:hypothetical protein
MREKTWSSVKSSRWNLKRLLRGSLRDERLVHAGRHLATQSLALTCGSRIAALCSRVQDTCECAWSAPKAVMRVPSRIAERSGVQLCISMKINVGDTRLEP